ncbi:uncharacterized protein LOC131048314 [Cryptomeria japonica]|uniref:uncharacterized protein LOC131048314 n=1 Tax=Cryptomeria japonica TaxID=3369 RepID=UPI0025AD07BC|nr:uncharacterized protein LOC131048314 [Cryptomeria japonica]
MDMSDTFFETIPVWVKLSRFPLEYWHGDIFKGIAGVFGELLSIDPMMAARKIMVYARICVGVSRSKDIPSLVELVSKLGMLVQTIEFELLPFVCFLCKKVGHWAKKCPQNTKIDPNKGPIIWKPKLVDAEIQNKKGDFVHQKGLDGSHETNKKNVVQHGQNNEAKEIGQEEDNRESIHGDQNLEAKDIDLKITSEEGPDKVIEEITKENVIIEKGEEQVLVEDLGMKLISWSSYEVDATILDAYAKMLIDAPTDESEKYFGTAKQKELEVKTKFNQKKRESQEGKRKKVEDPKEKDEKTRKQSERKVTFKVSVSQPAERKPTQKKRPVKDTPSSSGKKKKKEDIDEEIAKQIPAQLYNNLNDIRLSAMEEDRHIKIQALLTNYGSITLEEMDRCFETTNRTIFRSRHRTVSLMAGRVKEIISETNEAWVKLFIDNLDLFTSLEANPKSDTSDIPVDGKGKEEIQEEKASVQNEQVIDVEDNSPLDQNEQVLDTTNVELIVTDAAPSGKATSAKEDDIGENKLEEKDKEKNQEGEKEKVLQNEISVYAQSSEKKGEESRRDPMTRTTLLAITTTNAE